MVKIDESHPIFAMQERVQIAAKALFAKHQLSYFQYLRCYNDGSFSVLCNDLRIVKHFQDIGDEPLIYSSFDESLKNKQSFWFFLG